MPYSLSGLLSGAYGPITIGSGTTEYVVVFMKRGKRFGLSAEQKIDVWRRWKAGQTLHEIGRLLARTITPFVA